MKKSFWLMVLVLMSGSAMAQGNMWDAFARTKFSTKFNEKKNEYFFFPDFTSELKSMEGKAITLTGYFVPFSSEKGDYIILSKFPMAQCYFCGGGGPESIAEVTFTKTQRKFKVDDVLKIRGVLKLNTDDIEHVNFILTKAELLD